MKKISFIFTMLLCFLFVNAQDSLNLAKPNIFTILSRPDFLTGATVIFHQDKRIEMAMLDRKTKNDQTDQTVSGYRVQVFSSNAQRTAKGEAFNIEKKIRQVFPNEQVYVTYFSPFWKVRVGDFKTEDEAQDFRLLVISSFPKLKTDVYIVKDQINL